MSNTRFQTAPPVGRFIALAREEAGLNQAQLAQKSGLSPSGVSRIESGDKLPTDSELNALVNAIATQKARELRTYLGQKWKHLPQPAFDHPDRSVLWEAEQILEKLLALSRSEGADEGELRRAEFFETETRRLADYLSSREHRIAFIGTVGVGKSSALCKLARLEVDAEEKASRKAVLPVGEGHTTISEVRISHGPAFGVRIDARSEDDIRKYVEEFAAHLLKATGGKDAADGDEGQNGGFAISYEIEKAIRNMAGLSQKTRMEDKKRVTVDPAHDLARAHASHKDLVLRILDAMNLHARPRRDAWFEGKAEDRQAAMTWMRDTLAAINSGKHPEFTIPRLIEVILPEPIFGSRDLPLSIIDTKGIDGSPERPDIECHFADPRTLSVLCSSFRDAPNAVAQDLLRRAARLGLDTRTVEERVLMLVLAHGDQAERMKWPDGTEVESDAEGYEARRPQIELALNPLNLLGLSVEFFNSSREDAKPALAAIRDRLARLRAVYVAQVRDMATTVSKWLEDLKAKETTDAFRTVDRQLGAWIEKHRKLNWQDRPVQQSLIAAIQNERVASVINASVVRQGEYSGLDYYHHLGAGAQMIAAELIAEQRLAPFRTVVQNLIDTKDLAPAKDFLERLLDAVRAAQETALANAYHAGREVLKGDLKGDLSFWAWCVNRWGKGKGYKDDIMEKTDEQLSSNYDDAHKLLQNNIVAEWDRIVTWLTKVLKERKVPVQGQA